MILIQVGGHFRIRLIDTRHHICHHVGGGVRHLDCTVCGRQSDHPRQPHLFTGIERVCTADSKYVRRIVLPIPIPIKIPVNIVDKVLFLKKIESCLSIQPHCVTVYVIYQIYKVHSHSIELAQLIAHVCVTQFYQRCKLTPRKVRTIP